MRLRVDYDEIFDYYEVRVKIRGALSRVEYYGERSIIMRMMTTTRVVNTSILIRSEM